MYLFIYLLWLTVIMLLVSFVLYFSEKGGSLLHCHQACVWHHGNHSSGSRWVWRSWETKIAYVIIIEFRIGYPFSFPDLKGVDFFFSIKDLLNLYPSKYHYLMKSVNINLSMLHLVLN